MCQRVKSLSCYAVLNSLDIEQSQVLTRFTSLRLALIGAFPCCSGRKETVKSRAVLNQTKMDFLRHSDRPFMMTRGNHREKYQGKRIRRDLRVTVKNRIRFNSNREVCIRIFLSNFPITISFSSEITNRISPLRKKKHFTPIGSQNLYRTLISLLYPSIIRVIPQTRRSLQFVQPRGIITLKFRTSRNQWCLQYINLGIEDSLRFDFFQR